jgi:rhodanese-related sulfurtransferase
LDTVGLKALMDAQIPMVIVDARGGKWDDGKRIPGAVSLPGGSTPEAIEKALPSKDALIVAYCANPKCRASKELGEKLVSMGYKRVLKDPEGIQGWIDAGYPVTEVQKTK